MSGFNRGNHIALASGGMDSTVAAHVAVRWGPCDVIAYLDTGTGLRENREYVESLADTLGVLLITLRTPESYEDRVRENGFPGSSRHGIMYRTLKERQLQRLATLSGGRGNTSDLHLWTGVRSDESERRFRNVEPEQENDNGRWTWHAPIHDWTKGECRDYIEALNLPENPLWSTLGRSGDCFCGCFASREELIDLEAADCGYLANRLRDLESEIDVDDETAKWAWSSLTQAEQRAERADGRDMTLCSACGIPEVEEDGGRQ